VVHHEPDEGVSRRPREPGQLNILSEFFPAREPGPLRTLRAQVKSTNDTPFALPTIPVYMTKAFWMFRAATGPTSTSTAWPAQGSPAAAARNYCPEVNLTRAQMRSSWSAAPTAPTSCRARHRIFADVPIYDGDTTADFIEQLYNDGYTVGCSVDPLSTARPT